MASGRVATRIFCVLLGTVAAQDLAAITLPAGMTPEQAQALAQKNGIRGSSSGSSVTPPGTVNVVDRKAEVSASEGNVKVDSLDSVASSRRPTQRPTKDTPEPNLVLKRYGQSIFKDADPS